MVKVTVGSTMDRTEVIVSDEATPKQVLTEQKVDYSRATIHLDGAPITPAQMNTSFAKLGIVDTAMLIAVVKSDNA